VSSVKQFNKLHRIRFEALINLMNFLIAQSVEHAPLRQNFSLAEDSFLNFEFNRSTIDTTDG
jgi:hypothetical protein